eukprot:CAMPEP_0184556748 /NCGR_PEP_ID=MMETSP0199_2-20130426/41065_1 /TAXON_ID=1112570 /ORGANISM="Thraustochytrium sp., Strain LLF1b" /LENGTH=1621 /DNA_ID=CAMNT_0026953483 /DNA_START=287 /DNA_END=5152 /DNA_ORIENTATION=+
MLMSRNRREEQVRRSSYWAEFPSEERKKRSSVFAKSERRTASERRSSRWKSRFQAVLGRSRPESVRIDIKSMLNTGWESRRTLDGNTYYFELDTGRVQWSKPESLKTAKEKEDDAAEWVWVPHPGNMWQPAVVKSKEKNGAVSCRTMDGKTVTISHIRIMKGPLTNGVAQKVPLWPLKRAALDRIEDDLVALPDLDEGLILHNLRLRYENDDIYTWVGSSRSVLISFNPFKAIKIYSKEEMNKQRLGPNAASMGQELIPHVYGIANDSLDSLLFENRSQSILVSGESGAGKTHATKSCLDFLAQVASSRKAGAATRQARFEMTMAGGGALDQKVEHKVLVANPVLEAFGNAKTVRNNNSSRFGKWIAVYLDRKTKQINGAQITSFLLESSRIPLQAKGERNYHIFYQILQDADMCEKYMLEGGPDSFHYTNQSGSTTVDQLDEAAEFEATMNALELLEFEDEEREWLLRTTAALLHLGNVAFEEIRIGNQKGCKLAGSVGALVNSEAKKGDESSAVEPEEKSGDNDGEEGADTQETSADSPERSPAEVALQHAAELLELDFSALGRVLTQRTIIVRKEKSTIPLKVKQATQARDSLAKAIYTRMFDWLVSRVNESFGTATGKFIGILDIFGFEIFEHNSFEQLCINYCNERLQQLFNQHTFGDEEELYQIEKVQYRHIAFQDNTPVLTLIDKRPNGILNLLDDECVVPGGSDARLMGRIEAVHEKHRSFKSMGSGHKNKAVARGSGDTLSFTIKHFAGDVVYDCTGFIAKNSDTLFQDLYDICAESSDEITQILFPMLEENDRVKVVSQSGKFRSQLNELMEILRKTESRYIRCIKPNAEQAPNSFDGRKCLEQLKSSGVFEAVEIRKNGFPFRLTHDQFVRRYRCINLDYKYRANSETDAQTKKLCLEILEASPQKLAGVQIGETRVLYRVEDHKMLELLRDLALGTQVPKLQAAMRRALAVRMRKQLLEAELLLKDAMSGEPDLGTIETAIDDVPEILGKVGLLFRINPPSLAKAKKFHAGLEQFESVEEELEEFEEISDKSEMDVGAAKAVLARADRLRDDGIPMTERQMELYDHIKELMVGGKVEDLDEKGEEALETLERAKLDEVLKEAKTWAKTTGTLKKVKEVAEVYTKIDEDSKRAVEMVDHALAERVVKEADELGYSDANLEECKRLLSLDELDFVDLERACAIKWRDAKRSRHRRLRVREITLSRNFEAYADFFSCSSIRGGASPSNKCTSAIKLLTNSKNEAPSNLTLEEVAERRAITGDTELSPSKERSVLNRSNPLFQHSAKLKGSLLNLESQADVKLAQRCFDNIRVYMGDKKSTNSARNLSGLKLIKTGLEYEKLRDEIFAQLVKQLTYNPAQRSIIAGIDLLCLVSTAFTPGNEEMENFLSVWVKLHLPTSIYSTMMSNFHELRFCREKDELHRKLLALIYSRRVAFQADTQERVDSRGSKVENMPSFNTDLDEEANTGDAEDALYENIKAEHALQALRNRFKGFSGGSRHSQRQNWETDPWPKNPAFARYRALIVPEHFGLNQLVGFTSPADEAEIDTRTAALTQRVKTRFGVLKTSVRNTLDNLGSRDKPNHTGSVVEVAPSMSEKLSSTFGQIAASFRGKKE